MFYDYYLKAAHRAALESALVATVLAVNDEGQLYAAPDVNLDVIGVWPVRTGGTDDEPVYTNKPGYHANLRLPYALTPAQLAALPLIVPPDTPYRTWQSQ